MTSAKTSPDDAAAASIPAANGAVEPRVGRALDAVNFFLADVRDGLGPYLAIYLLAVRGPDQGWDESTVGLVITIAGIAGLIAQTPAGALIDRSSAKRAIVIAGAVAVTLASLTIPFLDNFYAVAAAQSVAGIAGAIFPPAIAAITLGIVGPKAFARRIGRNEAFNHAGNAASAAIAAVSAYFLGPLVVFWMMAFLAAASIFATLAIPARAIDNDVARGLLHDAGHEHEQPSGWQALIGNRSLLIFAACAVLFHLANASMLPTIGQKLTYIVGGAYATTLIASCIVAAQLVMVPVAMIVGAKADVWGRKPIFLVAFGVLALRGVLYTFSESPFWLVAVQCLDGVGAGIYGALFPIVVADLTRGTGRFNVSQGAIATAQGVGAALSASLAGFIIVGASTTEGYHPAGYTAAFLTLGAIAGLGFLLYLFVMPETMNAPAGTGSPPGGPRGAPLPTPAE